MHREFCHYNVDTVYDEAGNGESIASIEGGGRGREEEERTLELIFPLVPCVSFLSFLSPPASFFFQEWKSLDSEMGSGTALSATPLSVNDQEPLNFTSTTTAFSPGSRRVER